MARKATIEHLRHLIASTTTKARRKLRLVPLRVPILRLLAAPHCDDFSVESMTDVVVLEQQQKQQRTRFSQSLELRSLQHEEASRSTALPRNPCCGGTAPSPETLMSYLHGTRWTYRNLTLVAARTSFRGVVAARERQGFTMLFFGKDCAVLVCDMTKNQVGFETFKNRYIVGTPEFAIEKLSMYKKAVSPSKVICWPAMLTAALKVFTPA